MHRQILEACMPFAIVMIVAFGLLNLTIRLSRASWNWRRLKDLHRDQTGGVQSLALVLTLPVFIMLISLIVQVSQLMIGMIGVHYAAYAGARSAIVWLSADAVPDDSGNMQEGPNHVNSENFLFEHDPEGNEVRMTYGPNSLNSSLKYRKTWTAAVLALAPFGRSHDLGMGSPGDKVPFLIDTKEAILNYHSSALPNANPAKLDRRISRKLAWAEQNTLVYLEWRDQKGGLGRQRQTAQGDTYNPWDYTYTEFPNNPNLPIPYELNEVGWRDQVTVHVYHRFGLLPGFGALLRKVQRSWSFSGRHQHTNLVDIADWERVFNQAPVDKVPGSIVIHASAMMVNDGLIPIYGETLNEF